MDFCRLREIYRTNMENKYWTLLQKQDQIMKKLFPKNQFIEEIAILSEKELEILSDLRQIW